MNQYIIPANSKKGQLIFSLFRWVDLIILLTGAMVTLILLFAIKGDNLGALIIKLLPLGISLFLVIPLPYYHNVLVFIQEFMSYIMNQKQYLWRGWCSKYVEPNEQGSSKR